MHGISEATRRRALGIPEDAEKVLVVMESSHWDVNWLLTSSEYLRYRVAPIIDRVLDELAAEPDRVWNLEALWFLREYLALRPGRTDEIRELLISRRLRLAGFAWTTPDTLLPHPEALLRDYADGQRWLREFGIDLEPRTAYLPDSFGHSPALPSLFGALGVDAIALSRIDGMYFPGATWQPRSQFPVPGSTAAAMIEQGSADVVWRDQTGAELLTHWNAFTYGHGDLLASRGVSRWMGLPTSVAARSEAQVARRIQRYVADLRPLSRTPYLLLAAGFDFVDPIPRLSALLDRWNDKRYPTEGVWALTAGLDDYLALVDHHRADLPVMALDPNPYWTGFFASRPSIKRKVHTLVSGLIETESQALTESGAEGLAAAAARLQPAWQVALASNHHDFVTGTSPDRVVAKEQEPWLRGALAAVSPARQLRPVASHAGRLRFWSGMQVLAVTDSGGLWRMGHEFPGGRFAERCRFPAPGSGRIAGRPVQVGVTAVDDGSEMVRIDSSVAAAPGTSILLRIPLDCRVDGIRTGVTGGWIDRPAVREQMPTFWCVNDWLSVPGIAMLFDRPAAVAVEHGGGALLIVVGRNATGERAHRFVRFPGMPIGGHDDSPMELAAIAWRTDAVASAVAVEAVRDQVRPGGCPAVVLCDGAATHAAAIRAVVPDGDRVGVRVQVHEPGNYSLVASWPGADGGQWIQIDARGRVCADLGSQTGCHADDDAVSWVADRPGWWTWSWSRE